MAQFDHGVWATQTRKPSSLKGHLRFELFGAKPKGGWHLVRSGKPARQPQWLLFKDDDEFAGDIEADDLLADVAEAPAEDLKRAGAGKSAKRRLTAVPVKRIRRNELGESALALSRQERPQRRPVHSNRSWPAGRRRPRASSGSTKSVGRVPHPCHGRQGRGAAVVPQCTGMDRKIP